MSKSPFVDFKAIRAAITMEQVLEHYGILDQFKRSGDRLSGPCPIHKGSNPTQFSISVSKNIWNCFSECKHHGNVLDFIAKMEDVSIHAAALKAIAWFNLDTEAVSGEKSEAEETPARPALPSKPMAKGTESEEGGRPQGLPNKPLNFRLDKLEREHPYLTERGLSPETIIDFGIGLCSKGTMNGLIAIPIHNLKGEVMAYAGRYPAKELPEGIQKYKLPAGFKKSQELFNCDRAFKEAPDKPLLIVEGFFDCMKIHDHGYQKVVALMGSSLSAIQEEIIRQHTTVNSRVIVMLDENEAGITGREDIVLRLSKFCFVRVHPFNQPDMEPEHLTSEELADIVEGVG